MVIGPNRKDRRHRSYDEGADEPRGLINAEASDIEMEHPIDDTERVEKVEDKETVTPPMFEE